MKKFSYYAFYKPYGILSQFTSENPDETLSHFSLPKDIYAAGRLDKDSEGLLLLTDDGPFINKLANPINEKEKTYWVQVENIPDLDSLNKLSKGVTIGDYKTRPCKVRLLDQAQIPFGERNPPVRFRKSIPTTWIEIILTEGKNRQVRRMTASIGHPTLRLVRVKIGKIELFDLNPGEFKKINKEDIL
jgi:23S rRNA pseudouridine2457 synthase